MNAKIITGVVFLLVLSFAFMASRMIKGTANNRQSKKESKLNKQLDNKNMTNGKKVYIAGGCFWGMEDLFRERKGVLDTEVGYIGGENENPTYDNHPGHAEGIEITYDTTETNFKEILDYFFRIHNPTTVDQQGNDIGSSYRSAIFYQSEEEKQTAEEVIDIVNQSNRWDGKVVTTLEPYTKFWPAEDYHQDYLVKNPNGYTCHFERFGTFLDEK
jgi:peptide-methionine (S)-S-oxide reductase